MIEVIDNFFKDFEAIKRNATQTTYLRETRFFSGALSLHTTITQEIHDLAFKYNTYVEHEKTENYRPESSFRFKHANASHINRNFIHTDFPNCQSLIVYIHLPVNSGGTLFWKEKKSGKIKSDKEVRIHPKDKNQYEIWQKVDPKENRAILFHSEYLHSAGEIKPGRIIYSAFLKRRDK